MDEANAKLLAERLSAKVGVYRTFTFDLRSGARLAELPAKLGSLEVGINDAASGDISVPLALLRGNWASYVTPRRTGIVVMRDNAVVWCGIIWAHQPDLEGENIRLHCETLESYFKQRFVDTYEAAQVDQFVILQNLLADAFAFTGGDIRIAIPAVSPSGILRDRHYAYNDFKQLLEAIQQLSAVENGFDFTIDTTMNPFDEPIHTMRVGFPYLGRGGPGDVGGLTWQYPGNIVQHPSWPVDGRDAPNHMVAVGAGEGTAMLVAEVHDPDEVANGYPLLEQARQYKDVTRLSTLTEHAISDLAAVLGDVTVPEFSALAGVDPVIGSWSVGDWCRLRVSSLYLNGLYGPMGADVYGRITGWTLRPGLAGGDEGVEIVTPKISQIVGV